MGHPPRRKTCKKSPDGKHAFTITRDDSFNMSVTDGTIGRMIFTEFRCVHCGKKDIDADMDWDKSGRAENPPGTRDR